MTTAQVPEEIVEAAAKAVGRWRHATGSVNFEDRNIARAALDAVAPALMAEKDAEIKRLTKVSMTIERQRDTAIRQRDTFLEEFKTARADGAAEVSAAVEAVLNGRLGRTTYNFPKSDLERDLRAAISPEGIAAHNATIAADTLDSASKEAKERGDIGKPGCVTAEDWLARRAAATRGDV